MTAIDYFVKVDVVKEGVPVSVKGFGTPLGLFETTGADRVNYYSSVQGMTTVENPDFTADDPAVKWASAVFAQNPGPDQIAIGRRDTGEAVADALDAIETESSDWYFLNLESREDQDILDAAGWVQNRRKILVAQSSNLDFSNSNSDLAEALKAQNHTRAALVYYGDDGQYLDGAWTGRGAAANLDAAGGVITWANKSLVGIAPTDLTFDQAMNARSKNANIYQVVTSVNDATSPGVAAGGQFIDIQTTLDWTFFRVQEALFAILIGTSTKVPYTNAGIQLFVNGLQGVLDRGVLNGHFSPDEPPRASGPDISEVTSQEKEERKLNNLRGTARLAGAIHQLIVNVSVTA